MITFVLHHNRIQVIRVRQVSHRAERYVDMFIDVVIAILNLMLEDSNDLV